jgi:hypothetical protein
VRVHGGCRLAQPDQYDSVIFPAAYEYEQPWNPGWEPKQDGMSVSVRVAGLGSDAAAAARTARGTLCEKLGGTCQPLLQTTQGAPAS